MKLDFIKFILFVISATFLLACSESQTVIEKALEQKTLLVGNSADPSSLDPSLTTGSVEFKILSGLFEGLVVANTCDLSIEPAVAKSWEISEDKVTYLFHLDENAKWSDGSNIIAGDFVFAWRRILNPNLGAEYASLLFPIKNARALNSGVINDFSKLGVEALDDFTLKVTLQQPTAYFLSMLYHNAYYPLPQSLLERFGACNSRDARWTRPENMISNGAFTLEKWSINDVISIKRNPHFRAKEKIYLDRVKFFPISNINTEDRAFRANQLHLTDSIAPHRLNTIIKDSPQTLRRDNWLGVYYYIINTKKPPLDDARVRKALAMSINRRAIIDSFLRASQPEALNFVPENCDGYNLPDEYKIKENIKQAKELLAQAGYPDGKGFPSIQITYNTSEQHKPIAEAIQEMWKKNLGINIELYNLSWPAYLTARRNKDFDIARASWVGDYASPENFLDNFLSDSGLNHSQYKSDNFDNLMRKANLAKENDVRIRYLQLAEKEMLEDMPIIPIYFYLKVYQKSTMLKGWESNLLDYHNFHNVKLEDSKGKQ